MEEQEWVDELREKKVKEFSFFPHAFSRFKKDFEIELPDLDFESEESSDESKGSKNNSSTVKTYTLTIGGVAIGIATGAAAATLMTPPPAICPQPTPIVQNAALPVNSPRQPAVQSQTAQPTSSTSAPSPGSTGI